MQWFGMKNLRWRHIADSLRIDLRYAARQLMRAPVFVIVATLSLAVGTGAMVGALALVDMAFFRTMPVPEPSRLFHVYKSSDYGGYANSLYSSTSYPDYQAFLKSGAFSELAAITHMGGVFADRDHAPQRRDYALVSTNYFRTLGLPLHRGRMVVNAEREIVLAHPFWTSLYDSDPRVLGKVLKINGVEFTIVGIGPENFYGSGRTERAMYGWTSIESLVYTIPSWGRNLTRGSASFDMVGRLSPGMTAEAAVSRLTPIAASVAMQMEADRAARAKARAATGNSIANAGPPRSTAPPTVSLIPDTRDKLKPGEEARAAQAVAGIMLVVLLVLAIACVNVAGLLLARAMARQHEIAVRLALGASRKRLFAQLFCESVVLASLGAAAGCLAVLVTMRVANSFPAFAALGARADWKLIGYAVLAGAVSSILFGVMPVLQSLRLDLRTGLGAGQSTSVPAHRARGYIMTAQVAISCVLLIVSFSAVDAARAQMKTEIGFRTAGLLLSRVSGMPAAEVDSLVEAKYWRDYRRVVAETPNVESLTFVDFIPLDMESFMPPGPWPNGERGPLARPVEVDPDYFRTVRMQPLRGRLIEARDTSGMPAVVVVNETYVRAYQKNIGDFVISDIDSTRAQIVGVVTDVANRGPGSPPQPLLYYAAAQRGNGSHWKMMIRVKEGLEKETARNVEQRLIAHFPESIPPDVITMHEHVRSTTKDLRLMGGGMLGIGAIELALATVGLYGILMYNVLARRREIGVRLALGAQRSQVSWVVLWPALKSAAWGLGIGVVGGVLMVAFRGPEFGGVLFNPVPYLAALILAGIAASVAALVPARRAAAVDPATALRYE